MRGRKLFAVSDEQLKTVDWTRPNDVLAAALGVCATTVMRLRKTHGVNALRRGRPTGVKNKVVAQVEAPTTPEV